MADTIDIPLTGGLDLNDPRTLPPGSFSELNNADFSPGVKRRHGHDGYSVSDDTVQGGVIRFPQEAFLYGHGKYDPINPANVRDSAPGEIRGVATRGDEMLAWDGFRLLARDPAPSARWRRCGAHQAAGDIMDGYFPTATEHNAVYRSQPTGTQRHYDMAVGRYYTAYVWLEGTTPKYTIIVNETGHAITTARTLTTTSASVTFARVTYSETVQGAGAFFFTVNDSVNLDLYALIMTEGEMRTFHTFGASSPPEVVVSSAMVSAATPFDVRPASNGRVAYALVVAGPGLTLTYVGMDATTSSAVLSVAGAGVSAGPVGLAIHPDNTVMVSWFWNDAGTMKVMSAFYSVAGAALRLYAPTYVNFGTAVAAVTRVTCEFKYLLSLSDQYEGVVAWWDVSGGTEVLGVRDVQGPSVGGFVRRLGDVQLTHQLTRVGNTVFITVGYAPPGTLQWQLVVLAFEQVQSRLGLTPVASVMRGAFIDDSSGDGWVRSVAPWPSNEAINPAKFSLVNASGVPRPALVLVQQVETGAKAVTLDFLPPLRALDRGNVTWFPGGVVREWDGSTLAEVGHLTYPQPTLAPGAAGGLTPLATYLYRIYLVSVNAQGDVHRSAALTVQKTLVALENSFTITLPAIPFCTRDNVYWEIFRNTSSYPSQLQRSAVVIPASLTTARRTATTYVDSVPDANIITNAIDPAPVYTSSGYGLLDRVPPPSCEHLLAAKNRVWFHGGAVPPGQVAYSRLFDPGDAPAWNEALVVDVPGAGRITGLGLLNDIMVAFRETQAYAFGGPGPDNLGQGSFDEPRLARPDLGCISPDSVLALPYGLAFQSLGGIRALTPGLGVVNIGLPVDDALDASNPVTACARSTVSSQARFAVAGQSTYVLDYSDPEKPRWSRWTLPANGFAELNGYVLVAPKLRDSMVYSENPEVFTDGGLGYTFEFTLGWLPLGNANGARQGWGRADWLLVVGEWRGEHFLSGTVQYNYSWKYTDRWRWRPTTEYQSQLWDVSRPELDITYGVNEDTVNMYYSGPYILRRRFRSQRISAFQLSLSDTGANADSFMVSALTVVVRPNAGGQRIGSRNLANANQGSL